MLTPKKLALVDDFRFKKRMPSRAAAVRELLSEVSQPRDLTLRRLEPNQRILGSRRNKYALGATRAHTN